MPWQGTLKVPLPGKLVVGILTGFAFGLLVGNLSPGFFRAGGASSSGPCVKFCNYYSGN